MRCAEKEKLQRNCTAACDAYAAKVTEAGVPVDRLSGTVRLWSTGELLALRSSTPDRAFFAEALRLRGEHLRASRALSQHLSRHRC